jgi:hypothetical protein
MVAHACHTNPQEAETGRLRVQGQPGLLNELKANLSHVMRPCLKKPRTEDIAGGGVGGDCLACIRTWVPGPAPLNK